MAGREERRVGIMGGTFDPVHYGHLVAAAEVGDHFGLEKVVFVPAGRPPHKKNYPVTSAEHRFLMTALAVATNEGFEVSRFEIDRGGYSYTVDTLKAFHELYQDTRLYFITGADAIVEILTWKQVEMLLQLCEFVAVTRPGYRLDHLDEVFAKLPSGSRERVHLLHVPALAISSTEIRSRVAAKRAIKYLVPEPVEAYIRYNRLYQSVVRGTRVHV